MIRIRRWLPTVCAVLQGAACYHYVPAAEPAPALEEGAPVRMHLSTPRSFDVSGYTAHDIHRVDGAFVRRDGRDWVVQATALYAQGGARFDPALFAVTVPAEALRSAEVRQLSWWRTAVSAVAVGVGVYLASEAIQGTSATGDDGGEEVPRAVVPLP